MGYGKFDPNEYRSFTATTVNKTTDQIYTSRGIHKSLDPSGVTVRESRDSADNPNSTPIIVALDVTGSMGRLADVIAREGLGTLFQGILDRKPVPDPHLMFMAVGDADYDTAPLQVSQFEADARIIEQLTNIYLEHGGGGNGWESYDFPWYFAAFHTVHDSMEKRGKRGYLFTVGDEEAPHGISKEDIKRFIGIDTEANLTPQDMLALAQRLYDVYHIVVYEGDHMRHSKERVLNSWRDLIGEHVIGLADHTKLAETIVSAIEVAEGRDAHASAAAWGGHATAVVHDAIKHLTASRNNPRLLGSK